MIRCRPDACLGFHRISWMRCKWFVVWKSNSRNRHFRCESNHRVLEYKTKKIWGRDRETGGEEKRQTKRDGERQIYRERARERGGYRERDREKYILNKLHPLFICINQITVKVAKIAAVGNWTRICGCTPNPLTTRPRDGLSGIRLHYYITT